MDPKDDNGVINEPSKGEASNNRKEEEKEEEDIELSDDEKDITIEELERRIWRDSVLLKRLKKENKVEVNPKSSLLQRKRKAMSRAQDGILKHMLNMTEVCKVRGFIYGIIPDKGKPMSGSSENLRGWWKERVKFDKNGPLAISKYEKENGTLLKNNEMLINGEPITLRTLIELSDSTLCSILSKLMPYCDPPQRKFPLGKGIHPPWWPNGKESWWKELGFLENNDPGPPPYRKPHDLKKDWKICVVAAVIKKMCPNFETIKNVVRHSRTLQDKLSIKESFIWAGVIYNEEKIAREKFPELFSGKIDSGFAGGCGSVFVETENYDVEVEGVNSKMLDQHGKNCIFNDTSRCHDQTFHFADHGGANSKRVDHGSAFGGSAFVGSGFVGSGERQNNVQTNVNIAANVNVLQTLNNIVIENGANKRKINEISENMNQNQEGFTCINPQFQYLNNASSSKVSLMPTSNEVGNKRKCDLGKRIMQDHGFQQEGNARNNNHFQMIGVGGSQNHITHNHTDYHQHTALPLSQHMQAAVPGVLNSITGLHTGNNYSRGGGEGEMDSDLMEIYKSGNNYSRGGGEGEMDSDLMEIYKSGIRLQKNNTMNVMSANNMIQTSSVVNQNFQPQINHTSVQQNNTMMSDMIPNPQTMQPQSYISSVQPMMSTMIPTPVVGQNKQPQMENNLHGQHGGANSNYNSYNMPNGEVASNTGPSMHANVSTTITFDSFFDGDDNNYAFLDDPIVATPSYDFPWHCHDGN